jgi:hypothetical protein
MLKDQLQLCKNKNKTFETIELSIKSSKESIEKVSLLKIGNKVVEDIVK